jgi:hypothetical protein
MLKYHSHLEIVVPTLTLKVTYFYRVTIVSNVGYFCRAKDERIPSQFHKEHIQAKHCRECVDILNYFLAYFPYIEKLKVGLYDHHAVCVPPPPINFCMPVRVYGRCQQNVTWSWSSMLTK